MKNKTPTLTGSESVRRESISRERLIDSLPINKQFTEADLPFDITGYSLKLRMTEMPFVEMLTNKHGRVTYFLSTENEVKLFNWHYDRKCSDKPKKQKITKNKLSIADICQNIAEGMSVNNVLPGCAR